MRKLKIEQNGCLRILRKINKIIKEIRTEKINSTYEKREMKPREEEAVRWRREQMIRKTEERALPLT